MSALLTTTWASAANQWSQTIDATAFSTYHLVEVSNNPIPPEIKLIPTIRKDKKLSGEGWVDYDFVVPESGWYKVGYTGVTDAVDHDFYIDTAHVYGGYAGKISNAWLASGSHRLRVQRLTYPGFAGFTSFVITHSPDVLADSLRVQVANRSLVFRQGESLDLDIHSGGRPEPAILTAWIKDAKTDSVVKTLKVPLAPSAGEVVQRLSIPCTRAGLFYVSFGDGSGKIDSTDVREIQFVVVDTHRSGQPVGGDLKKTLIKQIDCATTPPDYTGGDTNVLHASFGSYRQSGDLGYLGSKDYNWFTYRLDVPEAQKPYLVEVEYPDDDCRTFCIALMEKDMMDYPPVGGVDSGGPFALTHKMQTQSFIYYPRGTDVVISFVNTQNGREAAASKIRLYTIDAPIPALKTPASSGRSFGYWLEEGDRWATFYGAPDKSVSGYIESMGRWAQVARYMGLDTLAPTVNIYQNVLFPTSYYDGYFRPAGGARDPMPLDVVRMLLLVSEKYGLKLLPEFHPTWNGYHRHDYDSKYASYPDPKPQLMVGKDGQVGHSSYEPYYSPIYPDNEKWYVGLLGEFAKEYKDSPALMGVSLRVMGWVWESHNGWPSLNWGYDDYTVQLFEKQTGVSIPVANSDPGRFRKRYDWLMEHARQKWIDWRCDQMTRLYRDVRDTIRKARPGLMVVAPVHGELDITYHDEQHRFSNTHDYPELLRECGFDMQKMAKLDGVMFLNAFHYYGRRQKTLADEQAGRDSLINPLARRALVTATGQTGYLFSNSYFEANSTIKPGDMGLPDSRPQGWVGVVNPAGRQFLERYALSLAEGDASLILDGGEGYLSGQPLLREFMQEYRQLPSARFHPRPDATDPAAVWELSNGASFWFYAVNRERYPVTLTMRLTGKGVITRPATGSTIGATAQTFTVTLEPFQIIVWKAAATRGIASVTTSAPADAVQHATEMVRWLEATNAAVKNGKQGTALSKAQKSTLDECASEALQCLRNKHWWRARTSMENHELLPIYDLIGDTPPGLAEYKAPPMPVSAQMAKELLSLAVTQVGSMPKLEQSDAAIPQWVGNTLLSTQDSTVQFRLNVPVAGRYALVFGHVSGGDFAPLQVIASGHALGATKQTAGSPRAIASRFPPVALQAGEQTITLTRLQGKQTAIAWMTLEPIYHDIVRSDWLTVGPFPSPLVNDHLADAFAHEFDPEINRDFTKDVPLGDGAQARWVEGTGDDSYIDLFDKYHKVGEVLSYGVTYVYSPTARTAQLSYDVDYWAKLWINGEKLADYTAERPVKSPNGRFVLNAELRQGWNEILIKVQSGSAGNGFWMAISDPGDLKLSPIGSANPPVIPWSFSPVPASSMKAAVLSGAAAKALEADLGTPGEIGIPDTVLGHKVVWRPLESAGKNRFRVPFEPGEAQSDARIFVVGHFFSPVVYRDQDYRIRLTCDKAASLYINGAKAGSTGGAQPCQVAVHGYEYKSGAGRFVIELPAVVDTHLSLSMAQPGDLHFFADLPDNLNKDLHVDDYPTLAISNGLINAVLAEPDTVKGYYRANRFEQAGMLLSLDFQGHTYFPAAPREHNPIDPHTPVGPSEECFDAIAWDDAKPGQPFIKFGVGLYEKSFAAQQAWYNPSWPIRMFEWKTRTGPNWAQFTQDARGPRGWRYRYVKRVVLVPGRPEMRIEHTLVNTGKNEIDIEQYNHNWISIDGALPGDGYSARVPYTPAAVKPSEIIHLTGNTISVDASDVAHIDVTGSGSSSSDNRVLISTKKNSATIDIAGDRPLSRAAVFSCPQAFSYEPFVTLHVKPGQTTQWSSTYTFAH